MEGCPDHISQGTVGARNTQKQPSTDLSLSAKSLGLSFLLSVLSASLAGELGKSALEGGMLTNHKSVKAPTAFSSILCTVVSSRVQPQCGIHIRSLYLAILLAVLHELSLLPVINSEPCWNAESSTCLFCWRVFWELCKLASWIYERNMENRIFTHNNSVSSGAWLPQNFPHITKNNLFDFTDNLTF